jgi:hypothetical protein
MSALDIFIHLIKCKFKLKLTYVVEKNPSLTKIYKDRMQQYLTRAEYIKKTALNKPDPEPTAGGTAEKKKGKGGDDKDEKDEEEKKM